MTGEKIYAVEHGHADECRELGKSISGLDREQWDNEKAGYMEAGVAAKFWSWDAASVAGEDMLGKLFQTGERELVYAVEDDRVWGIGFRPGDAAKNSERWGDNLLGKATMEARRVLRV